MHPSTTKMWSCFISRACSQAVCITSFGVFLMVNKRCWLDGKLHRSISVNIHKEWHSNKPVANFIPPTHWDRRQLCWTIWERMESVHLSVRGREIERQTAETLIVVREPMQSDSSSMGSRSLMSARKTFPKLLHFNRPHCVDINSDGLMDCCRSGQVQNLPSAWCRRSLD